MWLLRIIQRGYWFSSSERMKSRFCDTSLTDLKSNRSGSHIWLYVQGWHSERQTSHLKFSPSVRHWVMILEPNKIDRNLWKGNQPFLAEENQWIYVHTASRICSFCYRTDVWEVFGRPHSVKQSSFDSSLLEAWLKCKVFLIRISYSSGC